MNTSGFNRNNQFNTLSFNRSNQFNTGYSNQYKTNATQNKSENTNTNLTEDEVALAKEYEEYLEFNKIASDVLKKKLNGEDIGDTYDIQKDYKDRGISFNDTFENVIKAMGIQISDVSIRDITNRPTFNIPEGRTRVNVDSNSVTLTRGGRIYVKDAYIYIAQNHVSVFSNNQKFSTDAENLATEENLLSDYLNTGYSGIIEGLIGGADTQNVRFSEESTEIALKLLGQEMGLNTDKPMYVNGFEYEVVDGRLQTKGYTEPVPYDGISYLNNLLQKAYEQNMI